LKVQRLAEDNPAAVLTVVFILLFVATDIVNRAQGDGAFLTLKQISTTFLYAAVLGLMSAGQTLVMLTGGVDLSVATTATAGALGNFIDVFDPARARAERDLDSREHQGEALPSPDDADLPVRVDLESGTARIRKH